MPGTSFMTRPHCAALLALLAVLVWQPAQSEGAQPEVRRDQFFLMLFVDQGRTVGYQRLLAGIQLETVKAELERDRGILAQSEALYAKHAIPLIELEIARLKDAWNRKQLVVAEKNLEAVGAQFSAISQAVEAFSGEPIPLETLYAAFRRSWDAGCDKGPDEVAAMQAWAAYAETSLDRARQLNSRGTLSLSRVLEREAQLRIARSNHEARQARLDRCRTVLFPSLEDIMALGE
ncbi:MAG: hypothetical protein AAFV96_09770 [Pseudomonadota bacterium]